MKANTLNLLCPLYGLQFMQFRWEIPNSRSDSSPNSVASDCQNCLMSVLFVLFVVFAIESAPAMLRCRWKNVARCQRGVWQVLQRSAKCNNSLPVCDASDNFRILRLRRFGAVWHVWRVWHVTWDEQRDFFQAAEWALMQIDATPKNIQKASKIEP